MIDNLDIRDLLDTFHSVYGGPKVTDDAVAAWKAVLSDLTGDEAREAAFELLKNRDRRPTPADLLRVAREQRLAKEPPVVKGDPRGKIPIEEGARQILRELEARMARDGKVIHRKQPLRNFTTPTPKP